MHWLSQLLWYTLPLPAPCVQSAKPIFSVRSTSSRPQVSPGRRGYLATRVLSLKTEVSQVSRQQQNLCVSCPYRGPQAPGFHFCPPDRHGSTAEAAAESTLGSTVSLSLSPKVRQFGVSPGPVGRVLLMSHEHTLPSKPSTARHSLVGKPRFPA